MTARTSQYRTNPATVSGDGHWFHYLEDKVAAYLLSADATVPAPEIYCCVTGETDLQTELQECFDGLPAGDGVVVKATNFHSNKGIYVLVDDPDNEDPLNLLTNLHMSYEDTIADLMDLGATKIIVEQFIGKQLPTEYKFHVVNGEIAAIDIIDGRGTECPCYAVVDTDGETRLDQFGCFEPGGMEIEDLDGCIEIDFETGKLKAGPVKKDLNLCPEIPALDGCLLDEMKDIALGLGNKIGVAMRIDMFVVENKVYVQEYSPNPMNGLRHCAAKKDGDCIDSCFLGRMWAEAGGIYGGPATPVPTQLVNFDTLSPKEQCDLATGTQLKEYTPKQKCSSD